MKSVILDTESDGGGGALLQLAYILLEDGKTQAENLYFYPDHLTGAAEQVHGLTESFLSQQGVPYAQAAPQVLRDFRGATLIAHNLDADLRPLRDAFGPLEQTHGMCTMYYFTSRMALTPRQGRGYKPPNLGQWLMYEGVSRAEVDAACQQLFGVTGRPHDARWDACAVYAGLRAAIARRQCRKFF